MIAEKTYTTENACWDAVIARDATANGHFWYGVRTTGVFCKPSCGARTPLRTNVVFFHNVTQAKQSGLRPCKRCKPDQEATSQHAETIAAACRWLEEAEQEPSLNQLAKRFAMSPYHFHRVFKRLTGVTPKGYARSLRGQRVQQALQSQTSVTDAIYEAGYQASSRFYADAPTHLGMPPKHFKAGGIDVMIRHAIATTELGLMLIAATEKGLCMIHFGDSEADLNQLLRNRFPHARFAPSDSLFQQWVEELLAAVAKGQPPHIELPLDIRGTAFQQQVWQALRKIPLGHTASYAEVADAIGKPRAVRAVANACATNDLAVVIPCHRVIRKDGSAGGYRWGETRKTALLSKESAT